MGCIVWLVLMGYALLAIGLLSERPLVALVGTS